MPTYERFESLPVWQEAIRLAEGVDDFTRTTAKGTLTFSQRDQLERASLSVSNNIAEGFERGTTNELLAFLYIARGSAGEVRSMLCYLQNRPYLRYSKAQIAQLIPLAESCSKQLRAWADHLQNSHIKGQRHLNDLSRQQWQQHQEAKRKQSQWESQERHIIASMPPTHPLRLDYERKHGQL